MPTIEENLGGPSATTVQMAGGVEAPRVSVIMPVHNGMPYLPQAVESILGQTFHDFELIIMDDASTDGTPQYLSQLQDERVRIIRNEQNLGISRTLNKALRLARGEYIARQDADDLSFPRRLEQQVALLDNHSSVAWAGTDWVLMDEAGTTLLERVGAPCKDIDIKWHLLFNCPMPHTSVLARSSALEAVGYYPEEAEFQHAEDYELWSRLARRYEAASLPEPLVKWRLNSKSVSSCQHSSQVEQAARISQANVCWVTGRNAISSGERQAFDDANALFRASGGRDPQLPPARLRAAVAFLDALQKAFYRRYDFERADIAAHRRHWYWIWGKHLLALSLRTRAGLATRLTLLALGARYILGLAASFTIGSSRPRPQEGRTGCR